MNLAFAIATAVLFGAGAFLLLKRDLVRVVVGVSLISQSAILALVASALVRGAAPIHPLPAGPVTDPVAQALALTAIVIALAVTALLLVMVERLSRAYRSLAREEMEAAEVARESAMQHDRDRAPEPDEVAVE